MPDITQHPVQVRRLLCGDRAKVPEALALAAYEVYCYVNSPQRRLIEGDCRGGFHVSELLAFLYAKPFPQSEWRARVREAMVGMENL